MRRGAAGGPDTYAGLYQYRVRDILRVAGFHNAAPQFRFARRKNVLLSIESDKSDEAELQRVDRASALLRARCGAARRWWSTRRVYADHPRPLRHRLGAAGHQGQGSAGGRGRLLPGDGGDAQLGVPAEPCGGRLHRAAGDPAIRVVRSGTFEELMDYTISRGASIATRKSKLVKEK